MIYSYCIRERESGAIGVGAIEGGRGNNRGDELGVVRGQEGVYRTQKQQPKQKME